VQLHSRGVEDHDLPRRRDDGDRLVRENRRDNLLGSVGAGCCRAGGVQHDGVLQPGVDSAVVDHHGREHVEVAVFAFDNAAAPGAGPVPRCAQEVEPCGGAGEARAGASGVLQIELLAGDTLPAWDALAAPAAGPF
jgi:hypothetical protein